MVSRIHSPEAWIRLVVTATRFSAIATLCRSAMPCFASGLRTAFSTAARVLNRLLKCGLTPSSSGLSISKCALASAAAIAPMVSLVSMCVLSVRGSPRSAPGNAPKAGIR